MHKPSLFWKILLPILIVLIIVGTIIFIQNKKASDMSTDETIYGSWVSDTASEYPLTIQEDSNSLGITISWNPTIDSDIELAGTLLPSKRKDGYSGEIDFVSGDAEQKKEYVELVYFPSEEKIELLLPVLFEDSLEFIRSSPLLEAQCLSPDNVGVTYGDFSSDLIAQTKEYKKVESELPEDASLAIEDQTIDVDTHIYEYRVFSVLKEEDATVTWARFKVDMNERALYLYNPVEDEYTLHEESDELFTLNDC